MFFEGNGDVDDETDPEPPISPQTEQILRRLPQHTHQSFLRRRRHRWQEHGGAATTTTKVKAAADVDGSKDSTDDDDCYSSFAQLPMGSPLRRRKGRATSLRMPKEPSRYISPMPYSKHGHGDCSGSGDASEDDDEDNNNDNAKLLKGRIGTNVLPSISIYSPKKSVTTGKFPHAA
jgi:hypothetical protein